MIPLQTLTPVLHQCITPGLSGTFRVGRVWIGVGGAWFHCLTFVNNEVWEETYYMYLMKAVSSPRKFCENMHSLGFPAVPQNQIPWFFHNSFAVFPWSTQNNVINFNINKKQLNVLSKPPLYSNTKVQIYRQRFTFAGKCCQCLPRSIWTVALA